MSVLHICKLQVPPRLPACNATSVLCIRQCVRQAVCRLVSGLCCYDLVFILHHYRARKQGRPAAEFLRMLARSAHLAASHAGGLLEPLYALHAARLKLLDALPSPGSAGEGGAAAAGVLEAVARYCFLPPRTQSGSPRSGRCCHCGPAL